jgi:hypothetical protein
MDEHPAARTPRRAADVKHVTVDAELYEEVRAAAEHFQVPLETWVERALREKLAAEPIRPPADSGPGPVRTPYVEAGITTRDQRSSAG